MTEAGFWFLLPPGARHERIKINLGYSALRLYL